MSLKNVEEKITNDLYADLSESAVVYDVTTTIWSSLDLLMTASVVSGVEFVLSLGPYHSVLALVQESASIT